MLIDIMTDKGKMLAALDNMETYDEAKKLLIVACYGFNGERSECHRMTIKFSRLLQKLDAAVLRFDYLGLGISDGEFHHTTLSTKVDNLIAVLQLVLDEMVNVDNIVLLGFSDGAVVALQALQHFSGNAKLNGLLLWSPYVIAYEQKAIQENGISDRLHANGEQHNENRDNNGSKLGVGSRSDMNSTGEKGSTISMGSGVDLSGTGNKNGIDPKGSKFGIDSRSSISSTGDKDSKGLIAGQDTRLTAAPIKRYRIKRDQITVIPSYGLWRNLHYYNVPVALLLDSFSRENVNHFTVYGGGDATVMPTIMKLKQWNEPDKLLEISDADHTFNHSKWESEVLQQSIRWITQVYK